MAVGSSRRAIPAGQLGAADVVDYLVTHGLTADGDAVVEPLSGGVSADVFAVRAADGAWVVKQVLSQLKVEQAWHASPKRASTEARALLLASSIAPTNVPPLALFDEDRYIVVTELAPAALSDWKDQLLSGGARTSGATAAALGVFLASLHNATYQHPAVTATFSDTEPFMELRVDPFYQAVADLQPELAERLDLLAEQLVTQQLCLVHGDFSPKNILAASADLWVLDWEVAHYGNPVFDLAFLVAHLVCKSVHRSQDCDEFRLCAGIFVQNYLRDVRAELRPDADSLFGHAAAISLARVDGKSPASYLSEPQRSTLREVAVNWLAAPQPVDDPVDRLWKDLT